MNRMTSSRIKSSAWPAHSMSIALLRAAATSASSHKDDCLSVRAREEVEEGIAGGGSGPYLGGGGGGGGEEVWS